jgi:hypothetical protein
MSWQNKWRMTLVEIYLKHEDTKLLMQTRRTQKRKVEKGFANHQDTIALSRNTKGTGNV